MIENFIMLGFLGVGGLYLHHSLATGVTVDESKYDKTVTYKMFSRILPRMKRGHRCPRSDRIHCFNDHLGCRYFESFDSKTNKVVCSYQDKGKAVSNPNGNGEADSRSRYKPTAGKILDSKKLMDLKAEMPGWASRHSSPKKGELKIANKQYLTGFKNVTGIANIKGKKDCETLCIRCLHKNGEGMKPVHYILNEKGKARIVNGKTVKSFNNETKIKLGSIKPVKTSRKISYVKQSEKVTETKTRNEEKQDSSSQNVISTEIDRIAALLHKHKKLTFDAKLVNHLKIKPRKLYRHVKCLERYKFIETKMDPVYGMMLHWRDESDLIKNNMPRDTVKQELQKRKQVVMY